MDLNRDGDGFLVNTNDWSEEVMQQMAQEDVAKVQVSLPKQPEPPKKENENNK